MTHALEIASLFWLFGAGCMFFPAITSDRTSADKMLTVIVLWPLVFFVMLFRGAKELWEDGICLGLTDS